MIGFPRSPWRVFLERFVIALVLATVAMSGTVGYAFWWANAKVNSISDANIPDGVLDDPNGEPANFLIIGSDSRSFVADDDDTVDFGDPNRVSGQRSDTIMVAHVNPDDETGLLVSFPRDLWVDVPERGASKINAAFNGEQGPARLIETIQQNFDIPIHHYLEVNFEGFRSIVDAVGKVPLWFASPARDRYTGLRVRLPGCFEFNGTEALAYVRSRHYEAFDPEQGRYREDPLSDLGRILRQQYFIRSLASVAIEESADHPLKAERIVTNAVSQLTKDPGLGFSDLLSLVRTFRETDPELVEMRTVPTEPAEIDGQSVLLLREAQAELLFERLRDFGEDDEPSEPVPTDVLPSEVSVRVLNGSGVTGAARATLAALAGQGFRAVEPPADADRSDHADTELRYASGSQNKARLVAAYLGVGTLVEEGEAGDADVTVVLGRDFERVRVPSETTATSAAATPSSTVASTTTTARGPSPFTVTDVTAPSRPDGRQPAVGC